MKVKDLIQKLQSLDQEAEVVTPSHNWELGESIVSVTSVVQYNTAKKEIRPYFDAFDYESYEKEVYTTMDGNLPIVYIS